MRNRIRSWLKKQNDYTISMIVVFVIVVPSIFVGLVFGKA